MSVKHTPGPWVTYLNTMDDVVVRKINEAGYEQCVIARGVNYKNARLIAAAPELLAALNEVNNWLVCAAIASPEDMAQSFPHMQAVADAAIAKATNPD